MLSDLNNLFIDVRAHLIMPYHRLLDGAQERAKSEKAQIGTTGRGIGPCHSDKATRSGLRAGDLHDLERARTRLEMLLPQKNRELAFYGLPEADIEELMALLEKWAGTYRDMIIDTLPVVRDAYETGQKILLEGQLGVMRDLDWGIYPYTTSSSPTSGGAAIGSGLGPRRIDEVVGVTKVYSTSVGGGPFMTELFDEDGEKLRAIGKEFGATTGRPRRCGWFDAVATEFSCWINDFTALA